MSSEIVQSLSLPRQLSHLTEAVVIDWIKSKSEHPDVRNPTRYRARLRGKVADGDRETIENILIFAESGGQQPARSRYDQRKIGAIVQELTVRINLMKKHGCHPQEINKEISEILRMKMLSGEIYQNDLIKINEDLQIMLAMVS